MSSNLGSPGKLKQSNVDLLTSPIQENESGFNFEGKISSELQHPTNNQISNPKPFARNATDDSAQAGGKTVQTYGSDPSFNLGYNYDQKNSVKASKSEGHLDEDNGDPNCSTDQVGGFLKRARTPFAVLMDRNLIVFTAVIFSWHMSNSSVLPLVMQSLALEDPRAGILLSGLCILIAQAFMSYFAKVCGDYSPVYGRKTLMMIGLSALTLRCLLLTGLVSAEEALEDQGGSNLLKTLILSTQLLDAVGAGILGCLHILVTNDISGGTGRFSLMLGVTTGAMCLGATMSAYIGQAIAQDYGYPFAFTSLGFMSLVPLLLYALFMPETLPDYARPSQQTFQKRKRRLAALLRKFSEQKQRFVEKAMDKANSFVRRSSKSADDTSSSSKEEPLRPQQQQAQSSTHISATATAGIAPLPQASHVELV